MLLPLLLQLLFFKLLDSLLSLLKVDFASFKLLLEVAIKFVLDFIDVEGKVLNVFDYFKNENIFNFFAF